MSKPQRRKGNAKNASSAAAHEYLAHGGMNFVGLTPEMNIFEVASSNQLHAVTEIDDETRIVMKKLTKKDALTREKGLKELMELINSEKTTIENAYEHFCGLVSQLATDGSPAVRMLTMKTITLFLVKLKKLASKGLKKIIPLVLFARSDATNGVAAAASAVIRDGFDADKKQAVIQLFAPTTFEMAANIAMGKHELCTLKEYDACENEEARKMRLETQSLNVFLSYFKENSEISEAWELSARKLFQAPDFIKKAFGEKQKRESLKVQLLNICYKFSDNIDVILSAPTMVSYIQNTLDVQTFSTECATAWEGLILLMKHEKFYEKVSLMKAIVPRFLNVIRKKGNHWRVLKHYLLPAVVVLLQEISKLPDGNVEKTLTSIVESFTDNLPWSPDASLNAIHCWFQTFADFVRWILTNDRVNEQICEVLVPLTCKMAEQSIVIQTAESTDCISSLIFWMIQNNLSNEVSESQKFCELLEKIILDSPAEKSTYLRNALTFSGSLLQFSPLHARLLSNYHNITDFNVIRNLALADSEEYFELTVSLLENYEFLENTENFDAVQAEHVVKFISRVLNLEQKSSKIPKIEVKNDEVGRRLLLTENPKIWDTLLKSCPTEVFQQMIDYWHHHRNGKSNAKAVNFLQNMGIVLDTKEAAENVDFLISLLNSSDSGEKKTLVLKLFAALFEEDDEPKQEHFQSVADNLTADFESEQFFEKLFAETEDFETERILELAERFDKLIGLCLEEKRGKVAGNLLISEQEYDVMAGKLHYLELDVLTYSPKAHVISDDICKPIHHLAEKEATLMVKTFARKALFNLSSKFHTPIHEIFGCQMARSINAIADRYCLKSLDEDLIHLKTELENRVNHESDEIRNRILENRAPNFLVDVFGLKFAQERATWKNDVENSEDLAEKIETVLFDADGLKYMEHYYRAEHSFPLFEFDRKNRYECLANLIFVKKFIQCGPQVFNMENTEQRDNFLLGIVTILDNSADLLAENPDALSENPLLEALTANYLELFSILDKSAKSGEHSQEIADEWNEVFVSSMETYFLRMFLSIRKDQQPTPFVRSLLKVLFSLTEFPKDYPNDADEFVPELAVFNYPRFQEACIAHAFSLMTSDVEHVQLIGFAMARIMMPIMFKLENATALLPQNESEVVQNRPKLVLPVMIQKAIPPPTSSNIHPHLHAFLFDLALQPLATVDSNFGQEHRVAYCEAIDQFVRNALNVLLIDQPFDFRRQPILCRIPKSQERSYYLESDYTASPQFFDKFASRLLFKSISLLPAAVRLYYKSMSNSFMPMFHEAVTKYASKLLIEQELSKVKQAEFPGEMKVRTVPVTGEIIADYTVDETKMKLTIALPPDYPLAVPAMSLDKAIVKSDRAKKWLLQLNAYLFHQNGAILEGVEMWKRNVDKGIEGAEDCCICMMTVHQTTHQLPKVKCQQCKNKFHSSCLYKWFESSNQATCPLCRNNFT